MGLATTLSTGRSVPWKWLAYLASVLVLVAFAAFIGPKVLSTPGVSDAESYWMLDISDPYALRAGEGGAFLYSPFVAQVLDPFTLLSREAFYWLMMAANLGALVYLVGPIGGALSLLLPPVAEELAQGNIHLLLAAALVAGMTRPGWWAVFPLTKLTPSLLFAWNPRGLILTGLIVTASVLTVPELWVQWGERLVTSSSEVIPGHKLWTDWPLWFRLALASVVVLLARWKDKPLALPFALLLSLPIPWWNSMVVLLAAWRLRSCQGMRRPLPGRHADL